MKKALIIIFSLCLIFAGCSQEAAPLKVSYISASPALSASANIPSPTSEASASIVLDMGVPQYSESSPLPTVNKDGPSLYPAASPSPDDTDTPSSDDISPSDEDTDDPSPPPLSDTDILFKCSKDIDGDGVIENIYVASDSGPDCDDFFVYVKDGSKVNGTYIDSTISYGAAFYTITDTGKSCLIVSLNDEDEDTSTYVFSFIASSAVLADSLNGSASDVKGTQVEIDDWGDALRSWSFYQMFKLKDDCSLSAVTDMIITLDDDDKPLHTIKKLPVEMLVDGAYKPSFVKAGTDIYPVSTDCNSYLKFKLKDGSLGRIDYTFNGDEFLIDGKSEDDYFDNIIFWN